MPVGQRRGDAPARCALQITLLDPERFQHVLDGIRRFADGGRQVADAARVLRPSLKVLFITGYAESAVLDSGRLQHDMYIVTKPFAMDALARKIHEIIEHVE